MFYKIGVFKNFTTKVTGKNLRQSLFNKDTRLKGLLSVLKQYLATESSLKIMKNAFYFMLKTFFVLEIFTFLS